jgi:hypothetical protein
MAPRGCGLILLALCLSAASGFDLDAAFNEGKFVRMPEDGTYYLHPSRNPSYSMYFDREKDGNNPYQKAKRVDFLNGGFDDTDFKLGLSVMLLHFYPGSNESRRPVLEISWQYENASLWNKVMFNETVEFPQNTNNTVNESSIIRTWDHQDDFSVPSILSVRLNNPTFNSKVMHHFCLDHLLL